MAPKVELYAGQWTDVTPQSWVDGRGVEIERGRPDERGLVSAGRCGLSLDDTDGRFNDRNPLSDFYGLLGLNTPIRISNNPMSDTFTRSFTDGLGTSTSGHVWAVVNGTAANFDVTGSAATIFTNSVTAQVAVLPNRYGHVTALTKMRFSSMTGTPIAGIVTNWQNDQNHYEVTLSTIGLTLVRYAGGSSITVNESISISAATDYWLRVDMYGRLRAKFWQDGFPEPDAWTADMWAADPGVFGTLPLLPQLGRVGLVAYNGTSVTVTFDSFQVDSYRFHGEVTEWPVRPIVNDVATIPIVAAGPLRRLSQNAPNLQSAMYREATKASVVQYTAAYWPCEDGSDATTFASAVPGVEPLVMLDGGSFGQTSTIPGSKAMGVLASGASLHGVVPGIVDTTGKVFFRIVLDVPASPSTPDATNILNIYCSGSSAARFGLNYLTASGGALDLVAVAANQSVLESASLGGGLNGKRLYLSIELVQSGGNIAVTTARNEIAADNLSTASFVATDTWVGLTVGKMFAWSAGTMEGWGFCHVGVGNDQAFMFGMREALIGNAGETAGNRLLRVAGEAGIAMQIIGDPDETALMGPQVPGSGLDVLRSCEAADQGILYESRNEFGLSYRTLASMYTQSGPELDYAAEHLTGVDPTDDDQALANDVTITRINGSSARAELTTGKRSTQDAGRYIAPPVELGVGSDSQLANIAWWRLHIGTWDELRFRSISTTVSDPVFKTTPDLVAQLLALDSGDKFTIANPPPWLGVDDIGQLVQGYRETLAKDTPDSIDVEWHTSPAGPYNIGVWDDAGSRYDTDLSTLASGASQGASSLSVTSPAYGLWTTAGGDVPLFVRVAGVRVRVTAISGASSPQTFTVDSSTVTKALPSGAKVSLADPVYWGL